jgi:hypothetical protein
VMTSADPSRSVWDTQLDGGDWTSWRAADGPVEEKLVGDHDTKVKALGYVLSLTL